MQSHCIECVLLLLLHPALRLAGGCEKGLSVCTAIFSCCCLWLMCPVFVDSIFLTKEELASPWGHRLFMYQIYFCCHGLPGFTSHLLGWWKVVVVMGVWGGGAHCRIWAQCGGFLPLLLWNISTIFQQVFFFLKKKNVFLVINVWRIDASQLSLVHFKQQKQSLFPPGGISS